MINLGILLISFALASPTIMKTSENGSSVNVEIQQFGKHHLTKNCFKGTKPSCDAYAAITKKAVPRFPQATYPEHPAVKHCHEKGGIARILISADNKQYDYCRFADGSMIDSWDLYDNN